MEEECKYSCIDCATTHCSSPEGKYPDFCLTTHLEADARKENLREYEDAENHKIMAAAAAVEFEGYCRLTRVEETMEFARKIGAEKIGIATCVGLIRESRTLAKIFRAHGFQVYGVCCKAGATPKTQVGIDERCEAVGKNMCNPILQAQLLNREQTDLNVVVGLCVGHDGLFYRYSQAVTTTLVVKDRVLGHNPVAALYTAPSYYKKLLQKDGPGKNGR